MGASVKRGDHSGYNGGAVETGGYSGAWTGRYTGDISA